jgi:general secretion pathway protein D
MYIWGTVAALVGNDVVSNTAGGGGGLFLLFHTDVLTGNTIAHNTADSGGGLVLLASDTTLVNNLVVDNSASTNGSGLYVAASLAHLLHNTIADNEGCDSGVYLTQEWGAGSTATFTNTILVNHPVGIYVSGGNTATLHSTLWGSGAWANDTDWAGAGSIVTGTINIWGDPDFVDPEADDYHIGVASGALNAGAGAGVTTDIDGDPRPSGLAPDIGADEHLCHRTDIDCDCDVDVADIQAVAFHWRLEVGDTEYNPWYDTDGDDTITVVDIMQVVAEWGWSCGGGSPASEAKPDSTLPVAWIATGSDPALVAVEPLSSTVEPGETFSVSVVITDVEDLGAFQFEMGYDPSVVQVDDAALGPFLGSTGRNVSQLGPTIDNEAGKLTFGAFSFGTQSGPSGYGLLSAIDMTAGALGATPLDLDTVQVLYPSGASQAVTVEDGMVSIAGTRYLYLPLVIRQ